MPMPIIRKGKRNGNADQNLNSLEPYLQVCQIQVHDIFKRILKVQPVIRSIYMFSHLFRKTVSKTKPRELEQDDYKEENA